MGQSALLDAAAALSTLMDLKRGSLAVCSESRRVRLSDMAEVFADEKAHTAAREKNDALVYDVYRTDPHDQPRESALCYSTTIVHDGRIGDEYYMTRGHTHTHQDSPEIYLTIAGNGMMLLQTEDCQVQALAMEPGTVLYVPGATAHRIVNTGDEPLVTFAVYPALAGVNHEKVQPRRFKRIIMVTADGPDLVRNPRFHADQPGA